jgi:alanine dehydrogenase
MMALFLTETDVHELFPMDRALECVEASFIQQHSGQAVNRSRQRILLPRTSLHYMAAALPDQKLLGMKVYTVAYDALRFVVLLFSAESGDLLALIEADHLGRRRTAAASGVATKYLARQHASRLGIIGTGRQAHTQLDALAQVRKLQGVRVFSRDATRRRQFSEEMSQQLQLDIEPAESAEAAARFGDILVTATTSTQPVLQGEWLRLGTHVNAIGANMTIRREIDNVALARANVIAVDSLEQAKEEAGDLVQGLTSIPGGWDGVTELHDIIGGVRPGRISEEDITLFKSSGIALWDVAAAGYIYQQARKKGKGKELPIWEGQAAVGGTRFISH